MKKFLIFSLLSAMLLISKSTFAQSQSPLKVVPGTWMGRLTADGMDLRVVFNVKLTGKDSLSATLDSPDQGAAGIPAGKVTLDMQKFTLMAPSINGEYNGVVKGDSTIEGNWSQNGGTLPLNLKKQKGPVK
jgi:uncharacterized protein